MADPIPKAEGAYSEVFEEAMDSRPAQNIHHIRANSSIMRVKKILGEAPVYAYTSV
jgi:pyruvate carboxylase